MQNSELNFKIEFENKVNCPKKEMFKNQFLKESEDHIYRI